MAYQKVQWKILSQNDLIFYMLSTPTIFLLGAKYVAVPVAVLACAVLSVIVVTFYCIKRRKCEFCIDYYKVISMHKFTSHRKEKTVCSN